VNENFQGALSAVEEKFHDGTPNFSSAAERAPWKFSSMILLAVLMVDKHLIDFVSSKHVVSTISLLFDLEHVL
jgi:hypothetical protein